VLWAQVLEPVLAHKLPVGHQTGNPGGAEGGDKLLLLADFVIQKSNT
jgi:hypothetical protein